MLLAEVREEITKFSVENRPLACHRLDATTGPVDHVDRWYILWLHVRTITAIIWIVMGSTSPIVRFNVQLIAEDMAAKGWAKLDLATKAAVSDMTVIRFLRGEVQTARTAKKLARALGFSVRRYLVTSQETTAA